MSSNSSAKNKEKEGMQMIPKLNIGQIGLMKSSSKKQQSNDNKSKKVLPDEISAEETLLKNLLSQQLKLVQLQSNWLRDKDKKIRELTDKNIDLGNLVLKLECKIAELTMELKMNLAKEKISSANNNDANLDPNDKVSSTSSSDDILKKDGNSTAISEDNILPSKFRLNVRYGQQRRDLLRFNDEPILKLQKYCPPEIVENNKAKISVSVQTESVCDSNFEKSDSEQNIQEINEVRDLIEVPRWRENIIFRSSRSHGIENLDDSVFAKRHSKCEEEEKRRKRWDERKLREEKYLKKLRLRHFYGRNNKNKRKHQSSSDEVSDVDDSDNELRFEDFEKSGIKEKKLRKIMIQVTDVMAFGQPVPIIKEKEFKLPNSWKIP